MIINLSILTLKFYTYSLYYESVPLSSYWMIFFFFYRYKLETHPVYNLSNLVACGQADTFQDENLHTKNP